MTDKWQKLKMQVQIMSTLRTVSSKKDEGKISRIKQFVNENLWTIMFILIAIFAFAGSSVAFVQCDSGYRFSVGTFRNIC